MVFHNGVAIWRTLPLAALTCLLIFYPGPSFGETLAAGAKLTQLTTNGESRSEEMSPRGEWIAYRREISETQSQLHIMRTDRSEDRAVSPVGVPFYVEWSWGGDRLSYHFITNPEANSKGNVFVYSIAQDRSYPISQTYSAESLGSGRSNWSIDDKYVGYGLRSSANQEQVWIAHAKTGQYNRLLAERGEIDSQRWSPNKPDRLKVDVPSAGLYDDMVTVNADGTDVVMLTNIGAQSIRNENSTWSPTGEWIAYTSDLEMTKDEQTKGRNDVWVVRPDGSEARNLTQASSPSTEEQLSFTALEWSWDGKWILAAGNRFDEQGRSIRSLFLVDPQGGYELIQTSYPATTSELEQVQDLKWSYDSTKIALFMQRSRVNNWTDQPEFQNQRSAILIYDMQNRKMNEVFVLSDDRDFKIIEDSIWWTPDSTSILLTISKVISTDAEIVQPDLYFLKIPQALVGPDAHRYNGPPIGAGAQITSPTVSQASKVTREIAGEGAEEDEGRAGMQAVKAADATTETDATDAEIIAIVQPKHLKVSEIDKIIPGEYSQYLQSDASRNLFVFVGPESVHQQLVADLELIDFPAEHIIVDFLAIETSDEITRELGLDWAVTEGRFSYFFPEGQSVGDFTPGFQISPRVLNDPFSTFSNEEIADRFNVNEAADLLVGGLGTFPGAGQGFYSGVGKLPEEFFVRLRALQKDGEITILANPRTVATSGKESVIQIRRVVNFFFTEGVNLATGTANVRKSDVTATTEGRITPTLLADGKVNMVLDVTVGTVTFGAEDLPQQTDRKAQTEVTVAPGETIIIGGLRQQEHKLSETKTPILGDIPYLGKFFSKTVRENRHSVLTILITPRVMGQSLQPAPLPDPEWAEYEMDERYRIPIIGNGSLEGRPNKTENR